MPGQTVSTTMRTAARELGLKPRELELAVQLELVTTVPGAPGGPRKVAREELERVRSAEGFPDRLRQRLSVVGARDAAELMEISPSRFMRLARAGCFSPAKFYVNRYRNVVWLYLAEELRVFAEHSPGLLVGRLPVEMRAGLDEGADQRARLWRSRRVLQLVRASDSAWERVAARASVLDPDVLAEAVPDRRERVLLDMLMPRLVEVRSESEATREAVEELCLADGEDEVRWHRAMLATDLEIAQGLDPAPPARSASSQASASAAPSPWPVPVPGDRRRSGMVVQRERVPAPAAEPPVFAPAASADAGTVPAQAGEHVAPPRGRRRRLWGRFGKPVSRPAF